MASKRSLLLMFGLAVSALAQPAIYPSLLKIGAPFGSTIPVSDTVVLSYFGSLGPDAVFETSIRYTTSTSGWLTVSPATGRTPRKITLTADPSNLAAGTYQAQVFASVGPLNVSAWTTVVFIVAPTASNPGGLAVNPSSLVYKGQSSASEMTITVSNTPGGGVQPIGLSAFANSTGWLSVVQQDGATPATVKVRADPNGLVPGTYGGTVTVTAANGKSTVVPVTLGVVNNGPGQSITLTPAQRELQFQYQLNTTSNPPQTVIVSTDSTQYTQYTATASASWIGVAAASYIAPSSSTTAYAPGLLYVVVNPTGLAAGTYAGKVTLSSPGATAVDVPVTLVARAEPVMNVNPSFITLDTVSNVLASNLAVTGSTAFVFAASIAPNTPWLSISPKGGVASPYPVDLALTADVTGLPAGVYNSSVTITASGGSPRITIPIVLTVVAATVTARVDAAPKSLDLSVIAGDGVPLQPIWITSPLGLSQPFAVSAAAEGGWLAVDTMSGITPAMVKVTVNRELGPGSYTGSLVFTPLPDGDSFTVPVTYKVIARVLKASPASLVFVQAERGAAVPAQEVQVTANAASNFRIASQPGWAAVAASPGLRTPAKLTVTVNPTGLEAGTYEGAIQLTGPNEVSIPISLTVPSVPPPTATPLSLSFFHELGGPAPAGQSVKIENVSGATTFSATASTESGLNWLVISPSTGSTPGTITANLNVARLTPGKHTGAIAVRVDGAAARTLTIAVMLTVTGSAIQIRDVLNGAMLAPGPIAPGELVTFTGMGLGPVTPAVGRPSSAGAYGTELGGVRVFFDELPAPLLYAQDEQINAIVPYAVHGRATVRLQVRSDTSFSIPVEVKVAEAAPGIFVLGAAGRGQAAALNADNTPNSASNPVERGSVVVVFLTGEGQTDPPGQDGRIINTDLRKPLLPVTATVGETPAEVLYAGSASTLVSGVCQVNVRIPEGVSPGAQAIEVRVGGIASQRGVTISVR